MFSALSLEQGDLKDKLNIFIAICPITNIKYSDPPLGDLPKTVMEAFQSVTWALGVYEILSPAWIQFEQTICGSFPCDAITEFFSSNSSPWNDPAMSDVSAYKLSPASTKEVVHYAQTQEANNFLFFDYGSEGNFKRYG